MRIREINLAGTLLIVMLIVMGPAICAVLPAYTDTSNTDTASVNVDGKDVISVQSTDTDTTVQINTRRVLDILSKIKIDIREDD
jgi:hypothetical protein